MSENVKFERSEPLRASGLLLVARDDPENAGDGKPRVGLNVHNYFTQGTFRYRR